MANGNGLSGNPALRFTLSQVLQFLAIVIAGLLAWGNLKGDLREGFARVAGRLDNHEYRINALEHPGRHH